MRDLKPTGNKIRLGNNEYALRFTLNAIDEIQDHFDISISELGSVMQDGRNMFRNIRFVLTVLINEAIDCENDEIIQSGGTDRMLRVDEKYVGRHLDTKNLAGMGSDILKAVSDGTSKSDDDETPNV